MNGEDAVNDFWEVDKSIVKALVVEFNDNGKDAVHSFWYLKSEAVVVE